MNRKITGITALLFSGSILLTGCEKEEPVPWAPHKNAAVSIDEQGHITEYLSEKLEQDYYSFGELDQMMKDEVAAYNAQHGSGKITAAASESENGIVSLELVYDSWEDYAGFNRVEFYYGSMLGAQMEGFLFEETFQSVKDGKAISSSAASSDVLKHMDDMVVVASVPLEIHVPGKVTFTRVGAELLSEDTVYAEDTSQEDTEKSGRFYVIFEDQ